MNPIEIEVHSEIGELEHVIVHTPGPEVENMTPENAERALYSDILNLSVAKQEYSQFKQALQLHTNTWEVAKLLEDVLNIEGVKQQLLNSITQFETVHENIDYLLSLDPVSLTQLLIQGVVMKKDNLTRYFSEDRYSLMPLHNCFFTRDASCVIGHKVLINRMASDVRERESLIMEAIFDNHPLFVTQTYNPIRSRTYTSGMSTEGGDVLIARDDITIIGTGVRTTSLGVDYILSKMKEMEGVRHIIVQELPSKPESFIHLDMVFTLLDQEHCMVFEPIILTPNNYRTVHIKLDNGKVTICSEKNILESLRKLGIDLKPIFCGGQKDKWIQEREQWHSGANFFAVAPGKLIGYDRNVYTLEELNKNGFEIFAAQDLIDQKINPRNYQKYVAAINGAELARGGGGARCMSMPIKRKTVSW
jgi:arginine deiminase